MTDGKASALHRIAPFSGCGGAGGGVLTAQGVSRERHEAASHGDGVSTKSSVARKGS